jgi:hypothetical protein
VQYPPQTPLADFVRQWLAEHRRDLDYRLPDGKLVPFDNEELTDLLNGISLSGRVYATGYAGGGRGQATAVGKEKHRPGPRGEQRARVLAEMKAGIQSGRYTLEGLRKEKQIMLEAIFKAHHRTCEWALAQLTR